MSGKPARDDQGRLLPGHHMGGRPAGTSAIERFRRLVEPHWPAILTALITAAKSGDTKAAELIAQRMVPPARPQAERVVVPGLAEAPDPEAKAAAVTAAVARGEVSAEAGRALLGMLGEAVRIVEATDLERRIRALEGRQPRVIDPPEDLV